jgi:hyperosmotically inducible protein
MRGLKLFCSIPTVLMIGSMAACSSTPTKSPDVADSIRRSLDQAGLKDVSVSQDRDKGVVTLTGHTASDSDRSQAESIAKSIAVAEVVSDEIAVEPPGNESDARAMHSDLDKGIEKNFDAVLVQHKLKRDVRYDVKNGVITLNGKVNSPSRRAWVEKLASGVPNVKQVVNELQVRDQKATSSD